MQGINVATANRMADHILEYQNAGGCQGENIYLYHLKMEEKSGPVLDLSQKTALLATTAGDER